VWHDATHDNNDSIRTIHNRRCKDLLSTAANDTTDDTTRKQIEQEEETAFPESRNVTRERIFHTQRFITTHIQEAQRANAKPILHEE
jgi:hypothetical protein